MAQKMLDCFTNIFAEVVQHILGYSFYTKCHDLAHFCQSSYHLKDQRLFPQILICFGAKNVVEIEPRPFILAQC
jgi:hypothetical protein